jgi:hypothetical protein
VTTDDPVPGLKAGTPQVKDTVRVTAEGIVVRTQLGVTALPPGVYLMIENGTLHAELNGTLFGIFSQPWQVTAA